MFFFYQFFTFQKSLFQQTIKSVRQSLESKKSKKFQNYCQWIGVMKKNGHTPFCCKNCFELILDQKNKNFETYSM